MALDLPPKDAPANADEKGASTDKPKRATSTNAALSARVDRLEKLVEVMADAQFGANVRPPLGDEDNEEEGD